MFRNQNCFYKSYKKIHDLGNNLQFQFKNDGLKIDKVNKKKEGSGINFKYFLR